MWNFPKKVTYAQYSIPNTRYSRVNTGFFDETETKEKPYEQLFVPPLLLSGRPEQYAAL